MTFIDSILFYYHSRHNFFLSRIFSFINMDETNMN